MNRWPSHLSSFPCTSFRHFGGYQFNDYLGLEAGYIDFGEVGLSLGSSIGPIVASASADGFTMVSDDTSGDLTYGGGRYIYLDLPESDGPVTIDFNKLYNPPCAFSEFTTCLYPPRQNVLPFKVEAGEKLELTTL